jgi:hypothetical protein
MVAAREELETTPDRTGSLARVAGLEGVPTPFLAIDLDTMQGNISRMADAFAGRPQRLRPHAKAHKCSAIAPCRSRPARAA